MELYLHSPNMTPWHGVQLKKSTGTSTFAVSFEGRVWQCRVEERNTFRAKHLWALEIL
jgi:hypothetical protein